METLTLFSIILTIGVYVAARKFAFYVRSPFTIPFLTSTTVIILVFLAMDVTYEDYEEAKRWLTLLIGPATVSLAVPMYKNRQVIVEKWLPALVGIIVGTTSTILSAVWLTHLFRLSADIQTSAAVKAVTTPVAIETVALIGGSPTLTAAFVTLAGITGAVLGPAVLTFVRVYDPLARGIGIGTVSHAMGTSQILQEGSVQGAVSSVAMGIAGVLTALILPLVYRFL